MKTRGGVMGFLSDSPGWRRWGLRSLLFLAYGERGVFISRSGSITSPTDRRTAISLEAGTRVKRALRALNVEHLNSIPLTRVGGKFDGSYLMLDEEFQWAVSCGTSGNDDFDVAMAHRGTKVLQLDDSQDEAPSSHDNLEFRRRRVGAGVEELSATQLTELHHSIFKGEDFGKNSLLKVDIEGSEWLFLETVSDFSDYSQMIVEFHDLDRLGELAFSETAYSVWTKISMTHYLVSLNGNSHCGFTTVGGYSIPKVIECTFVLKETIDLKIAVSDTKPRHVAGTSAYANEAPLWLWGLEIEAREPSDGS